jgi:hypothetical protein
MLVFRAGAGRERILSSRALFELRDDLARSDVLSGLIRAGEIESALADSGVANADSGALTDELARALIRPTEAAGPLAHATEQVMRLGLPQALTLSAPEGFAYYALHPLDYVSLLRELQIESPVRVIGIRSIGTTLGAVVAAELECGRISVRPAGHPYNRVTRLSPAEQAWIVEGGNSGATFVVVDEGPGLSGSSFLSVGDALVAQGINRSQIRFLCSRKFDPNALVAPDAGKRCASFQWHCVKPAPRASADAVSFPNNDWREHFLTDLNRKDWPAVWNELSAPKFISADGLRFYKFEGLGPHGQQVRSRAEKLAAAGFVPAVQDAGNGYSAYQMVSAQPLNSSEASTAILDHMAEYLAFRAEAFAADATDDSAREEMARFNHRQITGEELDRDFTLEVSHPVIADGRMMPHEWIRDSRRRLWKLDAASHGDNHFFPGLVDIAWDIAGAIVEWELEEQAAAYLCDRYRVLSGDDAVGRLAPYITAYTCFQAGYAKMAAAAVGATDERSRLIRDAARYGRWLLDITARQERCSAAEEEPIYE